MLDGDGKPIRGTSIDRPDWIHDLDNACLRDQHGHRSCTGRILAAFASILIDSIIVMFHAAASCRCAFCECDGRNGSCRGVWKTGRTRAPASGSRGGRVTTQHAGVPLGKHHPLSRDHDRRSARICAPALHMAWHRRRAPMRCSFFHAASTAAASIFQKYRPLAPRELASELHHVLPNVVSWHDHRRTVTVGRTTQEGEPHHDRDHELLAGQGRQSSRESTSTGCSISRSLSTSWQ